MMKKVLILSLCVGVLMSGVLGGLVGVLRVHAEDDVGVEVVEVDPETEEVDDEAASEEDEMIEEKNDDENDDENKAPRLYIKAVNPGYKINGVNNVGEMIEIGRVGDPDTPISLAGAAVSYTNSSGNTSFLSEFPENSWMTGESLLLRLASSPGAELANVTYSKTLAMGASLSLVVDGEIVDEVCWTGKGDCYKAFNSATPTTLVRNLETGEFEHKLIYEPEYKAENYRVEMTEEEEEEVKVAMPHCAGLQFSETLSYYESAKSEQFIELYNAGTAEVNLDGCKVKYKNKKYALNGAVGAEGYYVYYPVGFSLTKNPTNANKLEILDADDTVVDTMEYPNGQRKGTAYAYLGVDAGGGEIWKVTYAPTPGTPNVYQEFKSCEEGKIINPATGNCVKVTSVTEKVCKEGYYLNTLTGRCKKLATTTEKTCKEGYYLNLETNRCRKVKDNTGANYSLEPENYEEESSFVALYAVLGVAGVGILYLVWEFRGEIGKLWRKVFRLSR